MVECLTLDQGVGGSILGSTGGTVSLSKVLYPLLRTGLTKEDPFPHD